ncbi:hypothetical protein [Levilactobacillus brevis]|nr:hypothetical protein [Levilactobacillus brevis]
MARFQGIIGIFASKKGAGHKFMWLAPFIPLDFGWVLVIDEL